MEEKKPKEGREARAVLPAGKKPGRLDRFFGVSASGSTVKTELFAGLITFVTMVYILVVNADLFTDVGGSGLTFGAAYIFTALGAVIGTLLMAFLARMPIAQATGMGPNAFFVVTVCGTLGYTYANGLLIVLCSGLLFLILTVVGARQAIVRAMPKAVQTAIPVGIGLFIAFVGMQNAGLIAADPSTKVTLVSFNILSGQTEAAVMIGAAVGLLSLICIGVLAGRKVKGAIPIGIALSTLAYYAFIGLGCAAGDASCRAVFDGITLSDPFQAFADFGTQAFGKVFTEGWQGLSSGRIFEFLAVMISFAMVDMFDTIGTLIGTCRGAGKESGLLDERGEIKNLNRALLSDSVATCTGAILGTSTVTSFLESSAGVAAGGRTGLTSLTVAVLFLLALFFSPLAALIPSAATAGALIYVGVLMMGRITEIDWKNPAEAIPPFLTVAMMSFTYSISYGIAAGFLSYTAIKLFTGKVREIHPVTAVLSVLFLFTFLFTH